MSARQIIKAVVFGVCLVLVSPAIALSWIEKHTLHSEGMFSFCAQLLALAPGRPGSYLRTAFYFGALNHCAWESHIGFGSIFTHRGGSIGTRASIGSYCVIGHADIGAAVMMGSRVSVPSGKRQHLDDAGRLTSGTSYDTVRIGARTWVGEGAIVLADVGQECIISAGAVVTKEMADRTLIAGNPARAIKELD
jgi:acetyltransferase-like isoleucine patch superfamily enzyme